MPPLLEAGPFAATIDTGRQLFDGVTVRLEAGGVTVLEGPSGTGKSTLLRRLVGLDPAPDSRRSLDGEAFDGSRLSEWRARVTLLPQDAPVLPGTVRDDLAFPYALKVASPRAFDADRAREVLDAVGLGEIALDRPTSDLSGGERHRLALARGLLWAPRVLVADEPLAALDAETAARCWKLVREFAHSDRRAVLTTLHDPSRAADADHRLVLSDGRLEAR
jgi:ABC-type multidrug transport system ATPase subunit